MKAVLAVVLPVSLKESPGIILFLRKKVMSMNGLDVSNYCWKSSCKESIMEVPRAMTGKGSLQAYQTI